MRRRTTQKEKCKNQKAEEEDEDNNEGRVTPNKATSPKLPHYYHPGSSMP